MNNVINQLRSIQDIARPGAEDACDRLNFVWTPFLLLLCSLVLFTKEYLGKPINCIFSGSSNPGFQDFAESYCWAHGTYAYSDKARIELTGFKDDSESGQMKYWTSSLYEQKLSYYQWVPFFLLVQCVLTYLPNLIWQVICSQRFGSDIYGLISLAVQAKTSDEKTFRQQAARIADVLERMLVFNREFRVGRLQRFKSAVYNRCNLLMPSKRLGTMLIALYVLVKFLCLANAIGQLVLMNAFFGSWRHGVFEYGWKVLKHLISNRSWQETMIFPLHTLCYVPIKIDAGVANNAQIGQCTLQVNIINEKIFILLYVWFLFLGAITTLSIVQWLYQLLCTCNRVSFVKHLLHLSDPHLPMDNSTIKSFISKFLRHDGVFLVLILSKASDKIITTEVLRLLYQRWNNKYHNFDFRKCESSLCMNMSSKTIVSAGVSVATSTALDESGLLSV